MFKNKIPSILIISALIQTLFFCSRNQEDSQIAAQKKILKNNISELILDNENRWLLNTAKGMISLIYLEATNKTPRLEHLGLIISEIINHNTDGIKAIEILTNESADKYKPFVSVYYEQDKRIIKTDKKTFIPENIKKDKKVYNFNFTIFSNPKINVTIKLYYTIDKLLYNIDRSFN